MECFRPAAARKAKVVGACCRRPAKVANEGGGTHEFEERRRAFRGSFVPRAKRGYRCEEEVHAVLGTRLRLEGTGYGERVIISEILFAKRELLEGGISDPLKRIALLLNELV